MCVCVRVRVCVLSFSFCFSLSPSFPPTLSPLPAPSDSACRYRPILCPLGTHTRSIPEKNSPHPQRPCFHVLGTGPKTLPPDTQLSQKMGTVRSLPWIPPPGLQLSQPRGQNANYSPRANSQLRFPDASLHAAV